MVFILDDYKDYFINSLGKPIFNKDNYLMNKSEDKKMFYKELLETQLFTQFIFNENELYKSRKTKEKKYSSTKSIDISKSNITKQLNLNLGKKEYLIINNLKLQKKKNQITLNNSKTNFNFLVKNQKTRSISPLNIDIIKKPNENNCKNKKTNLTMPNSVLDSPNRSYNKIILNLKTEFDEITRKTHSKDSKEKDNKTTSLNNSNYFYRNSNNNILILNKKKDKKKFIKSINGSRTKKRSKIQNRIMQNIFRNKGMSIWFKM